MLQELTHRIGFWMRRGLFVLSAMFVLLFVVEILKGHGPGPSAEFGIIWSAISTMIFLGTRIFYVSRGKNCPMCNDLPIRPKTQMLYLQGPVKSFIETGVQAAIADFSWNGSAWYDPRLSHTLFVRPFDTYRDMQTTSPRSFPDVLSRLHELEFDYDNGNGMDFEPYQSFTSEVETQRWFKAWTGNQNADGSKFWIFGQDGTGGYVAIWNSIEENDLLEQPIVFLGSEGELGVIAQNFSDYLWLLASGNGPYEAVAYPDDQRRPNEQFTNFAIAHASGGRRDMSEVLAVAKAKFPNFASKVQAQCN